MLPLTLFGPLDEIAETELIAGESVIVFVLFGLVVLNMVTRLVAFRSQVDQSDDSPEAISRHPAHVATTIVLILASFYFLTLEVHSGVVLSVLVLATFLADFFEFEFHKVRARRELTPTRPAAAIAASVVAFLYAGYLSVFFIIEPLWSAVI